MIEPPRHHGNRRFGTTRWSLILALGGAREPEARDALAMLCESYWTPVYAFIRRSGRSADEARDLTQAFFVGVIEKAYFEQARRERGRFRSFLLASVRHFLANDFDHALARKRGGGAAHVALDFDDGEERFAREPQDGATAEDLFERQWAARVFDAALARLHATHRAGWMKDSRFFEPLSRFVLEEPEEPHAALAARLNTSEASVRVVLHRIRAQFKTALRDVVADTVGDGAAVEPELRHLLTIVSRR